MTGVPPALYENAAGTAAATVALGRPVAALWTLKRVCERAVARTTMPSNVTSGGSAVTHEISPLNYGRLRA